ncbi:hypothetical protein [Helicobacter didelphidarum]|uniref:hypothetical protein n=1 Tax=Helicobacter didelphidarum TaxID=2040648 RepID=UPI0015F179D0|nr:hypothetical protein [Helicobacter didelphidarum]
MIYVKIENESKDFINALKALAKVADIKLTFEKENVKKSRKDSKGKKNNESI